MRIPDSTIDEVRSATDIVDLISSSVRLKKRGKNYIGLCPFHQEKTPSFNVSPERQMYHCFGCGVGGNVFTFLMEMEKVSFVEAVRTLAERAGISLPSESAEDARQATEHEALFRACREAGLFFYENLTTTVEGKLALEYFHHRGFSDETIRKFGLGYSMHGWDSLLKRAEQRNISPDLLERAGLVVRRDDGSGSYDRFRGRAMFPIFSPSGRTIGFGARKLREDDPLAKYINSPDTPVYNKSRNLYGLYQAREAIREQEYAVLVEGYADLISVFQAGVRNVVASSGTALTTEQIELIGRYARSVTLVYDADSAGSKAALRGVDLIIEGGLDVKVVELPPGEDPDSFVRKSGAEAFRALLESAASFLDYKAGAFRAQGFLSTPEGQTRAVRSIVETLSRMKDELKRNFYIKHLAESYGIYESVLFRELEKLGRERSRLSQARQDPSGPAGEAREADVVVPPSTTLTAPERDLLKLMVEGGKEMAISVFERLPAGAFRSPLAQQIIGLLRQRVEREMDWEPVSLITDIAHDDAKRFVADLVFARYEISKGWAEIDSMPEAADPWEIAERCLIILRREELEERIAENQRRLKDAASRGEEVTHFLERHQALLKERKDLERHGAAVPPSRPCK